MLLPGLRAQGSGKRDAVLPQSGEHVFPAYSWGLPAMAPFPLALFLISGNHLPLLLLLTTCDYFFFSFWEKKNNPHLPDRSPKPPPGEPATHLWRRHEPPPRPCTGHAGPSTAGFGGEVGSDALPATTPRQALSRV